MEHTSNKETAGTNPLPSTPHDVACSTLLDFEDEVDIPECDCMVDLPEA